MDIEKAARTAAAVFAFRNWEWYHGVPQAADLERTMESLLENVQDPESEYSETGRLVATKNTTEGETDTKICLILDDESYYQ